MRISDWSSDVCSSDLAYVNFLASLSGKPFVPIGSSGPLNQRCASLNAAGLPSVLPTLRTLSEDNVSWRAGLDFRLAPETLLYANISKGYKGGTFPVQGAVIEQQYRRSEEHTSELKSLMRISYAVFCLNTIKRYSYNK